MFKLFFLLFACFLLVLGFYLMYIGCIRFLSALLEIEIPNIFSSANRQEALTPSRQTLCIAPDSYELFEDFSAFVFDMVETYYKVLGVKKPNNLADICSSHINRQVSVSNSKLVFRYTIKRDEPLYEGGCRKAKRTYMDNQQLDEWLRNNLPDFLKPGYSFESVEGIATSDSVRIKIIGAQYTPVYGGGNIII